MRRPLRAFLPAAARVSPSSHLQHRRATAMREARTSLLSWSEQTNLVLHALTSADSDVNDLGVVDPYELIHAGHWLQVPFSDRYALPEYRELLSRLVEEKVPEREYYEHFVSAGLPITRQQLSEFSKDPESYNPKLSIFEKGFLPLARTYVLDTGSMTIEPFHDAVKTALLTNWHASARRIYTSVVKAVAEASATPRKWRRKRKKVSSAPEHEHVSPGVLVPYGLRPPLEGRLRSSAIWELFESDEKRVTPLTLRKLDELGCLGTVKQIQHLIRQMSSEHIILQWRYTGKLSIWVITVQKCRKKLEQNPEILGTKGEEILECLNRHGDVFFTEINTMDPLDSMGAWYTFSERLGQAMRGEAYETHVPNKGERNMAIVRQKPPVRPPYMDSPHPKTAVLWSIPNNQILISALEYQRMPGVPQQKHVHASWNRFSLWLRRVYEELLYTPPEDRTFHIGDSEDAIVAQLVALEPLVGMLSKGTLTPRRMHRGVRVVYLRTISAMRGAEVQKLTEQELKYFSVTEADDSTKREAKTELEEVRGAKMNSKMGRTHAVIRYTRVPFVGEAPPELKEIILTKLPVEHRLSMVMKGRLPCSVSQLIRKEVSAPENRFVTFLRQAVTNLFHKGKLQQTTCYGPEEDDLKRLFSSLGLQQKHLSSKGEHLEELRDLTTRVTIGKPVRDEEVDQLSRKLESLAPPRRSPISSSRLPVFGTFPEKFFREVAKLTSPTVKDLTRVAENGGFPGTADQFSLFLRQPEGPEKSGHYFGESAFKRWVLQLVESDYQPYERFAELKRATEVMKIDHETVHCASTSALLGMYEEMSGVLAGNDPELCVLHCNAVRIRATVPDYRGVELLGKQLLRLPAVGRTTAKQRLLLEGRRGTELRRMSLLDEYGLPGCMTQVHYRNDGAGDYSYSRFVEWLITVGDLIKVEPNDRTITLGQHEGKLLTALGDMDYGDPEGLSKDQLGAIYTVCQKVMQGKSPTVEDLRLQGEAHDVVQPNWGRYTEGKDGFVPWLGPFPKEMLKCVEEVAALMPQHVLQQVTGAVSRNAMLHLYDRLREDGLTASWGQLEKLLQGKKSVVPVNRTVPHHLKRFLLARMGNYRGMEVDAIIESLKLKKKYLATNRVVRELVFPRILDALNGKVVPITPKEVYNMSRQHENLHRMPYIGRPPAAVIALSESLPLSEQLDHLDAHGAACSLAQLEHQTIGTFQEFKQWLWRVAQHLRGEDVYDFGGHSSAVLQAADACGVRELKKGVPAAFYDAVYKILVGVLAGNDCDLRQAELVAGMMSLRASENETGRLSKAAMLALQVVTRGYNPAVLECVSEKLRSVARYRIQRHDSQLDDLSSIEHVIKNRLQRVLQI